MKICRILCQRVAGLVDHYSQFHPSPLSMKTLVDFGKLRFICVLRSPLMNLKQLIQWLTVILLLRFYPKVSILMCAKKIFFK